jgi:hypothetical protein
MDSTLSPQTKNIACFYNKNESGISGWLTEEDVLYLMDYILTYDTIEVEDYPNIQIDGINWYGFRLKASKILFLKRLSFWMKNEETLKYQM